jgi:hypothetical protein
MPIQCAEQDATKNPNPSLQLVVLQMHAAGNMLHYAVGVHPVVQILSGQNYNLMGLKLADNLVKRRERIQSCKFTPTRNQTRVTCDHT